MSIAVGGNRVQWPRLPEHVRQGVEEILGSPVVQASSQPGGFSPGSADRVQTSAGTRAFVKACSTELNDFSVVLHRREARITAALPPEAPAPKVLGSYEAGDWFALVLEDVPGQHPQVPWQRHELEAVLSTLNQLSELPSPQIDLPDAAADLSEDFTGWQRIRLDPPERLDPWIIENLGLLEDLASQAAEAIRGDTMVHRDIRADNILLTDQGPVLVDWPWTARGAAWFDALCLLINVNLTGGHDIEELAAAHLSEATAEEINAVLSGFTGFFFDAARLPPPPGLPTIRGFHRKQGKAALAWLRRRLGV